MEKRYVSETEILDEIVFSFKYTYGFAPAKKSITLLETSGYAKPNRRQREVHYYDWVAFHVNGKGYDYSPTYYRIERNENYDI